MSEPESVDAALLAEAQRHVSWAMSTGAGRRDRARAVSYVHGLLGPTERKSVEPMLRAQLGGIHRARERRMTESLTDGDWSHRAVMLHGAERLVREIGTRSPMRAYVLDDTALLKKGRHSVGVANQYAGCVGGLANCQVIVTLAMVNDVVHPLIAGELFMPAAWFDEAHAELRARPGGRRRGSASRSKDVLPRHRAMRRSRPRSRPMRGRR
jgi:SRSO17 transposase